MRVLFQNRDTEAWIGGDQIQLEETRKALRKLGIDSEFSSKCSWGEEYMEQPIDADIVHCFNFSMPWSKYQIWNASKQKKKIVCSMIYHETEDFIDYNTQRLMADEVSAFIFLTAGERDRALRHLDIPQEKIHIIPNGIDTWWFEPTVAPYECDVLTIGRIDANKGQLAVAQACKKLGLRYTCIGTGEGYSLLVSAEGATIIPAIEHKLLKTYYASCRVYASVGYKEIMPLTVMEAGAQRKPIVLTDGCEWLVDKYGVQRAEYNNVDNIAKAIERALKTNPTAFQDYLRGLTWDRAAKDVLSVYRKVLSV